MAERLVHIVDDAEVLGRGPVTSRWSCVLTGFLDAGKSAELAARHLDRACRTARSWRPSTSTRSTTTAPGARPCPFVRDHYADYEAPRLVVRALRDTGGTPFLLLHRPRARHPLGGLRPRRARGRRALRRVPRGQPGRGADGGAAHPPDRDHPARQPSRPGARREPLAGRAAGPGERPGAARDPAGGVGPRRARLRRAHPRTTSRRWSTRRPRWCCWSTSRSAAG